MKTATSTAAGAINVPVTSVPGQIYKVAIEFPGSGDSGPSAGTVGIYHDDGTNQTLDRDDAGTASEVTATGTALGAAFTVVAHDETLVLIGASLGSTKDVLYSVTPVR